MDPYHRMWFVKHLGKRKVWQLEDDLPQSNLNTLDLIYYIWNAILIIWKISGIQLPNSHNLKVKQQTA
jgi:hypothetical protein